MKFYDIYNPTTARRVIYDGIISPELLNAKVPSVDPMGNQTMVPYSPSANDMKTISIDAGETVKRVALADHIAAKLKAYADRAMGQFGRNGFMQELQIREHVEEELGDEPKLPPFRWPDAA